jgi:hypothetical protein
MPSAVPMGIRKRSDAPCDIVCVAVALARYRCPLIGHSSLNGQLGRFTTSGLF